LFCGIPLAASLLAAGAAGALEVLVAAGEDDVVGEVLELLLDPPQPARAKASPTAAVASQVLRLGVGIADSSLLSLWVPPGCSRSSRALPGGCAGKRAYSYLDAQRRRIFLSGR
jgi:hypothetical protein